MLSRHCWRCRGTVWSIVSPAMNHPSTLDSLAEEALKEVYDALPSGMLYCLLLPLQATHCTPQGVPHSYNIPKNGKSPSLSPRASLLTQLNSVRLILMLFLHWILNCFIFFNSLPCFIVLLYKLQAITYNYKL